VTDDAARGPIPADPRAQSESAAAPGATRNVFPLYAAALTTCFGAHSGRSLLHANTCVRAPRAVKGADRPTRVRRGHLMSRRPYPGQSESSMTSTKLPRWKPGT
jgi:hypothetical protein